MHKNWIAFFIICVFSGSCVPVAEHKIRASFETIECATFRRMITVDVSDIVEVNKGTLELTESAKINLLKVVKSIDECNTEQINVVVFYNTNSRIEFDETLVFTQNIKLFIEKNVPPAEKIIWALRYLGSSDLIEHRLVYLEVLPKNYQRRMGIKKSKMRIILPKY